MSTTNLETILERLTSKEDDGWQTLNVLQSYLDKGGEDLSKEEYIRTRHLIDDKYRPFIQFYENQLYNHNRDVFKERSRQINNLLADYITDQHYKLLDEYDIKVKEDIPQTIPTNKRRQLYNLERTMWNRNKDLEMEKQLIDLVPEEGLSKYKVQTLQRMLPKTNYFTRLKSKISGYFRKAA